MLFLPVIQQENCVHVHMTLKHASMFSEPQQGFQNLDEVYVALMRQYFRFIKNRRNSRGRVMS